MSNRLWALSFALFSVACTTVEPQEAPEPKTDLWSWTTPVWWRSPGPDQGLGVAPFDADSLVVAGRTESGLGQSDAFVSRVKQPGEVLWTKTLGSSGMDLFLDVGVHPSGIIFAAGVSTGDFEGETLGIFSDGVVSALDEDGEVLWNLLLGMGSINQLQVVSDGVLVTGSGIQSGHADADAFVAKISLAGQLVWNRWIDEAGMESATGIAWDGEQIAVVGFREDGTSMENSAGTLDGWLALLETNGEILQITPWDLGANESLTRVCVRDDGTLMAAGYTDVNEDIDSVVVTFDPADQEVAHWVSEWRGEDAAYSLLCAENGHAYLSGRIDVDDRSDAFWVQLDERLNVQRTEIASHPGRDEWVDLTFWHDAICAVGYRWHPEAAVAEDMDALLDCMR